VLTALDVLHQLYASEQRKLPAGVPDLISDAGVAQADWDGADY
jgi:hypothetical protein